MIGQVIVTIDVNSNTIKTSGISISDNFPDGVNGISFIWRKTGYNTTPIKNTYKYVIKIII